MKYIKNVLKSLGELRGLHKYARDIIHGSIQFTIVLYVFSAVIYTIAPYTPDYLRSIAYYQGALEIAPVTLAAGIVCALLCDLVMRKTVTEKKPNDDDKKE